MGGEGRGGKKKDSGGLMHRPRGKIVEGTVKKSK